MPDPSDVTCGAVSVYVMTVAAFRVTVIAVPERPSESVFVVANVLFELRPAVIAAVVSGFLVTMSYQRLGDVRAFLRKTHRNGLADSAARTRDERNFSF